MIPMRAAIYRTIIAIALVSLVALLAACGDQGFGTTDVPTSVVTSVVVATPTPTLTPEPVVSATAVFAVTTSASSSSLPSSSPEPTSPAASPTTVPLAETPSEAVVGFWRHRYTFHRLSSPLPNQ